MTSVRDRFLGRSIPPVVLTIRADFTPESDAVFVEVESASLALQDAEASGADIAPARERLAAAQAAVAPYAEVLQAVVLLPDEYDELVSEHPPTAEQRAEGHTSWNPDTFPPALLAACLRQDGGPVMSADDWSAWAKTPGAVASGEFAVLFNTCVRQNDRSPSVRVGKGFGGPSS